MIDESLADRGGPLEVLVHPAQHVGVVHERFHAVVPRLVACEGGIALAMMDDFEFEATGPVVLEKGDMLFLYTDGIVEAMSPAREPFGIVRIEDILRSGRDLPAKEIVERVRSAVRLHTGTDGREDDLTLVVAKITG